ASAPRAMPRACAPMPMRPESRPAIATSLKPFPWVPRIAPRGIRAPSRVTALVSEACSPSLCSALPTITPGVPAGTRTAVIPACGPELLEHEREGDGRGPQAAVRLRHVHAEHAEIAERANDIRRDGAVILGPRDAVREALHERGDARREIALVRAGERIHQLP